MSRCNFEKKHTRKPKKIPYGGTKGHYWCLGCDVVEIPDYKYKPRKKTARQKAKKELKREYRETK